MQHTEVLVFHLHRLIAVQILAGFRQSEEVLERLFKEQTGTK